MPAVVEVGAADPAVDATATRTAELAELNDLRTKVAQPAVCTPAATVTPTATPTPTNTATPEPTATIVPAVPIGTEVTTANGLIFTFTAINPIPTPDSVEANGRLIRVTFRVSNESNDSKRVPLEEWRLVDATGNEFRVDTLALAQIDGVRWSFAVSAHDSENRSLIFDVTPDSGPVFTLESTVDPAFRVALPIEARG
jgi:hypothetical protein